MWTVYFGGINFFVSSYISGISRTLANSLTQYSMWLKSSSGLTSKIHRISSISTGRCEGVFLTSLKAELFSQLQKFWPVFLFTQNKRINIAGHSRSAEQRRCQTADNNARALPFLKPSDEVFQSRVQRLQIRFFMQLSCPFQFFPITPDIVFFHLPFWQIQRLGKPHKSRGLGKTHFEWSLP